MKEVTIKMSKSQELKKIYCRGYAKTKDYFNRDIRLNNIVHLLKRYLQRSPQRLLDVGCGDGYFAKYLGDILNVKYVYGIDISENAIQEAKNYGVRAVRMDIDEEDFPFENGFFDLILCANLIELVFDPDHLLKEIYRVLDFRGISIVSFPNLSSWANRLALLLGFQPYYDIVSRYYDVGKFMSKPKLYPVPSKGFLRLYTWRSFKQLVKFYGFKIIDIIGVEEKSIPKFLRPIDSILSNIPSLAFQNICLLKK